MTVEEFKTKWVKYFQDQGIWADKMSGINEEHRHFIKDLDELIEDERMAEREGRE